MKELESIIQELLSLVEQWEPRLLALANDVITERRNSQNRTIKQIVGHMVDSASNNTHRIIHLQYQKNPLICRTMRILGITTDGLQFRTTRMKNGTTSFNYGSIATSTLPM
ncbi:MAG: hypothetical protein ACYSU4_18700 [Planctomycetota bacterium]|jgi:hypothetical protein